MCKPVLDESHDDLESVCQDGVSVVAFLDGLYEDVGPASFDGQTHRVLEHPVLEATLEHLKLRFMMFLIAII